MKTLLFCWIAVAATIQAGSLDPQPKKEINGIQVIKATWSAPHSQPQPVTPKIERLLRMSNASAENPVSVVVSEDFAQYKTGIDSTYRGTVSGNSVYISKESAPVLTIIYRVNGVQKMVSAALGERIVLP